MISIAYFFQNFILNSKTVSFVLEILLQKHFVLFAILFRKSRVLILILGDNFLWLQEIAHGILVGGYLGFFQGKTDFVRKGEQIFWNFGQNYFAHAIRFQV